MCTNSDEYGDGVSATDGVLGGLDVLGEVGELQRLRRPHALLVQLLDPLVHRQPLGLVVRRVAEPLACKHTTPQRHYTYINELNLSAATSFEASHKKRLESEKLRGNGPL